MNTSRSSGARRSRLTAVLVVLAVAAATLLAVGIGGEFYVRNTVSKCIAEAVEEEAGGPVSAGFGPAPILLSAVTHRVGRVDVDSTSMDLRSPNGTVLRGIALDARISDITLPRDGRDGAAGSSTATVDWPAEAMLRSLQDLPFGFAVTGVDADEGADRITVEFLAGVGTLTLSPQIQGGAVTMEVVEVSALGLGLPSDFAQQIVDRLAEDLADYPLEMRPTEVSVSGSGLHLALRGGHATLPADSVDCRIF